MNYSKQILILIITTSVLLSCKEKKAEKTDNNLIKSSVTTEEKQISVASNNEAIDIYTKMIFNKNSLFKYQAKIIALLDKAISNDPQCIEYS